jgi:hypothetical protein
MAARVGDYIVLFKSAGGCDLFKIDETGQRAPVRQNLGSPQDARRIARGSLPSGGQVWVCDEATPNVIDPY